MEIVRSSFGWLRRVGADARSLLVLELLMPGGTMLALLLFLYRRGNLPGSRPCLCIPHDQGASDEIPVSCLSRRSEADRRSRQRVQDTAGRRCGRAGTTSPRKRCKPVHTATTVRVRNGKVAVTDGPFAETKEQLAGFYLIDAADLNEAIQLAAKIPPARVGSVEVRPVRELSA